jgi:hypothetical protein
MEQAVHQERTKYVHCNTRHVVSHSNRNNTSLNVRNLCSVYCYKKHISSSAAGQMDLFLEIRDIKM